MLWYYAPTLLMLLQSVFSFPRDKTTEKPISAMTNPKQRRPTHISEFTDPDTGLNPFLDLEEGLESKARNVMEDETRDYESHFDIDLVEGDANDRRWNLHEPKEHPGRMPVRRPELDYKDESDYFAVVTTPLVLPNPPTTVESVVVTRGLDGVKSDAIEEEVKEVRHQFKKEEQGSFIVSQSTVIYATTTVAVMTVVILLVGAYWWRRKLKTMRPSTSVESGEVKS